MWNGGLCMGTDTEDVRIYKCDTTTYLVAWWENSNDFKILLYRFRAFGFLTCFSIFQNNL